VTALNQLTDPLLSADQDFSAAFVALNGIKGVVQRAPTIPVAPVFRVCERLLASPVYRQQKQAYFFFQAVAETLLSVAMRPGPREAPDRCQALKMLRSGMDTSHSGLRRAMAEALGMLPLAVDRRPAGSDPMGSTVPSGPLPVCDANWLAGHGVQVVNGWDWQGRSMRAPTRTGKILVIKCLRQGEDPAALGREAAWMDCLRARRPFRRPFAVPRPLAHGKGYLVQAPRNSAHSATRAGLHPKGYAIVFLASPAYFHYPNETAMGRQLAGEQVLEVLSRNAWLMGWLMAEGMAHTAPIPLFHNRAQGHRREDGGRYRWTHAGRLDRWLASSRHPNFGVSGLRDFEHFAFIAGQPRSRYDIIGSHLISLLLVAGSYFRHKAPERMGRDPAGLPVDARDLFDRDLLQTMISDIWHAYYEGFTGDPLPVDGQQVPENLVDRMIDEMGVDRHMEEILRVVDQEAMDPAMFVAFLRSRGIPQKEAARIPKGKDDIPLMTGPHLGGFNQPISLPEMIDFAAVGAACCVAGRFENEVERDG
jgi:hypothetical protein